MAFHATDVALEFEQWVARLIAMLEAQGARGLHEEDVQAIKSRGWVMAGN